MPSFNQDAPSRRIVPVLSRSGNSYLLASGNKTNEVSMSSPLSDSAALGINSDLSFLA